MNNKVICLVYPVGINDENLLLRNGGSIQTIGGELYQTIKKNFSELEPVLYNPNILPNKNDVLLILQTLPLAPLEILKKFDNVAYWFDDISSGKIANEEKYQDVIKFVSLIAHPINFRVNQLRATELPSRISCEYVPWTIHNKPVHIQKSLRPSILLDLDDRPPCIESVPRAVNFLREVSGLDIDILIPSKFRSFFEGTNSVNTRVIYFDPLPHSGYIKLLSESWCYASGIPGSYEYSALESAFCGCCLISINNALPIEHERSISYLNTSQCPEIKSSVAQLLAMLNPNEVRKCAELKYPNAAAKLLEKLIIKKFLYKTV